MSEYNPHLFSAKKSLGQNFLIDRNIIQKIVNAANIATEDIIVEIGPGPGALTYPILKSNPQKLYLVEKDVSIAQHWKDFESNLITVVTDDALKIDIDSLTKGKTYKIISNLPYNVGTELLINWLGCKNIQSMVLMFQKEVVERIVAQPNTKAYGRLSILTQWLCKVEKLFDVSPSAFKPAPKVTSSVVKITPRSKPLFDATQKALEQVTQACFHQRRKMLRKSLKPLFGDETEAICEQVGINPSSRPEELSIEQFCGLAKFMN
jgi:16S rRNA (adenine1518-N6/adenine1519-N6)-dimethyltransferase